MKGVNRLLFALACVMVVSQADADADWKFGAEVDAVPYLLNGYYVSATAGLAHWQLRYVRTNYETPSFYLENGFEDDEVDVNALILDYYFSDNFHGFWLGAGVEDWQGNVTESASKVAQEYQAQLITVGGGYAYYFNKHCYLNPWIGVHIPMAGDDKIVFENSDFDIKPKAEISLKLGFKF